MHDKHTFNGDHPQLRTHGFQFGTAHFCVPHACANGFGAVTLVAPRCATFPRELCNPIPRTVGQPPRFARLSPIVNGCKPFLTIRLANCFAVDEISLALVVSNVLPEKKQPLVQLRCCRCAFSSSMTNSSSLAVALAMATVGATSDLSLLNSQLGLLKCDLVV